MCWYIIYLFFIFFIVRLVLDWSFCHFYRQFSWHGRPNYQTWRRERERETTTDANMFEITAMSHIGILDEFFPPESGKISYIYIFVLYVQHLLSDLRQWLFTELALFVQMKSCRRPSAWFFCYGTTVNMDVWAA